MGSDSQISTTSTKNSFSYFYRRMICSGQHQQGDAAKIQAFVWEIATGRPEVNDEFVPFWKDWIVNHLLVEDRAFKTQCQVETGKDKH